MSERLPDACEERKDDLVALALGEPLEAREAALRSHLETCDGCKAYFAAMTGTVGAVRALPVPEPSAALTERILAAARADADAAKASDGERAGMLERWLDTIRAVFRRPLLASAVASGVVAVVAVVILLLSGREDGSRAGGAGRPIVARLENPTASPTPGAPSAGEPTAGAPPAAIARWESVPEPSTDSASLGEDRNREIAPSRPTREADAPAETPIMAVVTGAPAAGASPDESERARGPGEGPVHVALAQPSLPAVTGEEQAVRRGGQATTPTTAPQAAPTGAAAGRSEGEADGDSSTRFVTGVEVSTEGAEARADASARGAGDTTTGATSAPVDASPVTVVAVADASDDRREQQQTAAAENGYRYPERAASAGSETPASPPSASPPPPAISEPAQPAAVAYGGVAEGGVAGDAETGGRDYYADEYAGVSVASTVSIPPAAGWGGSAGAPATPSPPPPPPPPADDVETARQRLAEGQAAEAEEILEDALRGQVTRGADTTYLLAEAYVRQGKWSDAARTYELFLARYLDDARADEARWRAADAYRRSGATTRAAALLEQLVGVPGYDSRARTVLDEMAVGDVGRASAETTAGQTTATEAPAAPPAQPSEPAGPGP
ncbi:MAG: hypothetical protein HY905_12280 [Deltaproteobacteria bacterium]|nr:hypothetical protein [Deltaproteobacteria bacterium]